MWPVYTQTCLPQLCSSKDTLTRLTAGTPDAEAVAGLLLQQLARHVIDKLADSIPDILPVVYRSRWHADADTAALWQDVWTELGVSDSSVLSQHGNAVVSPLVNALAADEWSHRSAAAATIASASTAAPEAFAPHAPRLMAALLEQLPGRVWGGKEVLVAAVGTLAQRCGSAFGGTAALDGAHVVAALAAVVERPSGTLVAAAATALVAAISGLAGQDVLQQVVGLVRSPSGAAGASPGSAEPWSLCRRCWASCTGVAVLPDHTCHCGIQILPMKCALCSDEVCSVLCHCGVQMPLMKCGVVRSYPFVVGITCHRGMYTAGLPAVQGCHKETLPVKARPLSHRCRRLRL